MNTFQVGYIVTSVFQTYDIYWIMGNVVLTKVMGK